jgi:hypothetical protein
MAAGDGASKEAEVEDARAVVAAAASAAKSTAQAALADAAQAAKAGARRTKELEEQCAGEAVGVGRGGATHEQRAAGAGTRRDQRHVEAVHHGPLRGEEGRTLKPLCLPMGLKTFDCVPRLAGRRAPLIASLIGLSASDCLPHELAGHTPIRTAPGSSL